jgi:hypothetical protein
MKAALFLALLLVSFSCMLCLRSAEFWSATAHRITADIATDYISAAAATKIRSTLGAGVTMANESMWADYVKRVPEWSFSSPFHYVNTDDCSIDMGKSCRNDACIVGAIANYTRRLTHSSADERKTALRFIIHLTGDISQPMHIGRSTDLGGNRVIVYFFGTKTNLHSLWDGGIIGKRLDEDFGDDPEKFSTYLRQQLRKEPWKSKIPSWQRCSAPGTKVCPLEWGQEGGQIACDVCYKGVGNETRLADAYYRRALPVTEEQIVKGAIRLASILDFVYSSRK